MFRPSHECTSVMNGPGQSVLLIQVGLAWAAHDGYDIIKLKLFKIRFNRVSTCRFVYHYC